jgi:hypothetical protein
LEDVAEGARADETWISPKIECIAKGLIGFLMNAKTFNFGPLAIGVGSGAIAVPPVEVWLIAERLANDAAALIRDVQVAVVRERAVRRVIQDGRLFDSLEAAEAGRYGRPCRDEYRRRAEHSGDK